MDAGDARGRARRAFGHPDDDSAAQGIHRQAARSLPYPEGTACAKVLIVGEHGGSNARTVFLGFGLGLCTRF